MSPRRRLFALALLTLWLALDGLYTLLIGTEAEGSEVGTTALATERAYAFSLTASASGTLETIRYHTSTGSNGAATSVRAALMTDSSGKPGEVLEEKVLEGSPNVKEKAYDVIGFSHAVTSGTKYWLVLLCIGGAVRLKLSTTGGTEIQQAAKASTITAATGWATGVGDVPAFVVGLGKETEASTARPLMVV